MIDIEGVKSKISELAEKYGLNLVILFGSQVTGKTHKHSDVDIAFLSGKHFSLRQIAEMELAISQELKLKNIELVDLKTAPPLLLEQIARKSILLYEKERSDYARSKIYAHKRYMESRKLRQLREASLHKFLQKA